MVSDSDLDTSSEPVSHVELVDSNLMNLIHMIQILLYVTTLYTTEIN